MPRSPRESASADRTPDAADEPRTTPADQLPPATSEEQDGSTMIQHVTMLKRDVRYDHGAEQASLRVRVHFRDGRTTDTALLLDPAQMQVFAIQMERAIDARQDALSRRLG
ncbi:hypothetical protein [Streptomyces sp. H27-D2]|uniref:hypothetical protein n=1 Tax=Streptomyces sp. H27-D2 TaxID=3046304 RepID=UPI002DB9C878|nr:hypothetical protein [Streptomyces sp. H27-D2]MEC4015305.1 hypothetical protein [Streptomyces sp. H27-D2]